jgi:protein O-GlcNAc transferase
MRDHAAVRRILAMDPANFEAAEERYSREHDAGNMTSAILCGRRAAAIASGRPDEFLKLSEIYRDLGELLRSSTYARRALVLKPDFAKAMEILSVNQWDLTRSSYEVASSYLRMVSVDPLFAHGWSTLAELYADMQLFEFAERALRRSLSADPACAIAHSHLGKFHRDLAEPTAALRCYDRAVAADGSEHLRRDMLLALLYDPETTEESRFGRQIVGRGRKSSWQSRPILRHQSGDRIHVAYLSSKFFDHPTGRTFVRVIEGHDRARVKLSVISNSDYRDEVSARFAAAADQWHDVSGQSTAAIAGIIQEAKVDILVPVAGYFDPVCWSVAALRPAPIQVALGDVATTGMDVVDYLMSDIVLSPRGTSERTSERLFRLPCLQRQELPSDAPPVTSLPALHNGYLTFGSLNNSAKLNDRVLALWAATVAAVPTSRMRIWAHALAGSRLADRTLRIFSEAGVEPWRIRIETRKEESPSRVLQFYDNVDIGLDTFPFSGGMTTFQAMCQGVPVVTLPGDYMVGRFGAVYAIQTGHSSLIARTPAEFVAIARGLASDLNALAVIRARLRQDVVSSPLCDGRGQARHLERAFRFMLSRLRGQVAAPQKGRT